MMAVKNRDITMKRTIYPNLGTSTYQNHFHDNLIKTTKYRWWNFIPKNLFEQFHRVANIYFVFIVCLNWVPAINAFGKELAMIPVIFVLSVTAVKDGYEDYCRHLSDKRINNRKSIRVSGKDIRTVTWKDICAGDIIRVSCDEMIPADMLFVSGSNSHGTCFVETASLDGENNLKQRHLVAGSVLESEEEYKLEVETPCAELGKFHGQIIFADGKRLTAGSESLLLRGCILRNTDYVQGIVLYAGADTKTMLNSQAPRYKRSQLERSMNRDVVWCVAALILLCFICAIGSGVWLSSFRGRENVPYLVFGDDLEHSPYYQAFIVFWTFIIVFQVIIPVSLYVSIEVIKMSQVYFIKNDLEIYDPISDQPTECRAFNITEDLGRVQHVFTDKTGTLTENRMQFHCCSIGGADYPHQSAGPESTIEADILASLKRPRDATQPTDKDVMIREFMALILLCNTVVVKETKDDRAFVSNKTEEMMESEMHTEIETPSSEILSNRYQAESSDELALVKMAGCYGYMLQHRTPNEVKITLTDGTHMKYQVLQIFHFTADRKRMSIIVRCPHSNKITLYCKGADGVIFDRLVKQDDERQESVVAATKVHIDKYANTGLRTLCMAKREISEEEFTLCQEMMASAKSSSEREARTQEAAERLEINLQLLGATGIEDKLQPGVCDTIESLKEAHINVWMLTGDKQETAISVGRACGLISSCDQIITLNARTQEDVYNLLRNAVERHKNVGASARQSVVVIDGDTLQLALNEQNLCHLVALIRVAPSVICCRTTPAQKASMVKLVQDKLHLLSLAIGDGANDVSMIQTADVGVGISGQEGMQAVMAADFAIPRFRFLKRLLLVHGHWSYYRLAVMTLYMFYKNSVFVFLLFWFQLYSGFSGTRMLSQWNLVLFTVAYTAVPPVVFAIFDQDIPDSVLMSQAWRYRNEIYPAYKFWLNILDALYQSLVMYFIPHFTYMDSTVGLWEFGVSASVICTLVTLIHLAIQVKYWCWPQVLGFILSLVFMWAWCLLFDAVCVSCDSTESTYMVTKHAVQEWLFWAVVMVTTVVALLPRFVLQVHLRSSALNMSWDESGVNKKKYPLLRRNSTKQTSYEDAELDSSCDEDKSLLSSL